MDYVKKYVGHGKTIEQIREYFDNKYELALARVKYQLKMRRRLTLFEKDKLYYYLLHSINRADMEMIYTCVEFGVDTHKYNYLAFKRACARCDQKLSKYFYDLFVDLDYIDIPKLKEEIFYSPFADREKKAEFCVFLNNLIKDFKKKKAAKNKLI